MKIGVAISSLGGGGAEHVVRLWCEELVGAGHSVVVYADSESAQADDAVALLPAGVPYRRFPPTAGVARHVRLPLWLRRNVLADDRDVVVSNLSYTNLATLLALKLLGTRQVPVVLVEHSLPTVLFRTRGRSGRTQAWVARRIYRRADAAIGVSHAVATDLTVTYGIAADRTYVVPNAILPSTPAAARPPVAQDGDPLTLLFVGRIEPPKQPLVFVRAAAELASAGRTVRIAVIGSGSMQPQMDEAATRAGLPIEHHGWSEDWPDVAARYPGACLLVASHVEGLGNVLIEAAAAGIPSVASSTALGVADAIIPGVTGALAMSARPSDLAAAVVEATASPNAGTARWLDRFTARSSTQSLIRVLNAVVPPENGPF